MKLYTSWGNDTLKDLTKLVGLLGVFGNHLHLSKVEDGCIAVIWLCSISVAEDLKDAIPEVSDALHKGVLQGGRGSVSSCQGCAAVTCVFWVCMWYSTGLEESLGVGVHTFLQALLW